LSHNATESSLRNIIAQTASNAHRTRPGAVPEVAMATCLTNLNPPRTLEFLDDLSHLHDDTSVGGVSVFDQVPVHIGIGSAPVKLIMSASRRPCKPQYLRPVSGGAPIVAWQRLRDGAVRWFEL